MESTHFSKQTLVEQAQFSREDFAQIRSCRRLHNQLGFAYQLAFVKLLNRFPETNPFEQYIDSLLTYVSYQVSISASQINRYQDRLQTVYEHQQRIGDYLNLTRWSEDHTEQLASYLFEQSLRTDQTTALKALARTFLHQQRILEPADYTLTRLTQRERERARHHIYGRIAEMLSDTARQHLDTLLVSGDQYFTPFQFIKQPPGHPSAASVLKLTRKIEVMDQTGALALDLTWLNNNYQRSLTKYAERCSADRLRQLQPAHRYSVLVCFLHQMHRETVDYLVDMLYKIVTRVYNRAQHDVEDHVKKQRKLLRRTLSTFRMLGQTILNDEITDVELRNSLFNQVDREKLHEQVVEVDLYLDGKYSNTFQRVVSRYHYLRQFTPTLLHHIEIEAASPQATATTEALDLLQHLNETGKRKLPEDSPLDFIPKKHRAKALKEGSPDRAAWECLLLTQLRDDIKQGNLSVKGSKRFSKLESFFIASNIWQPARKDFFQRAGLPVHPQAAVEYLTERLNAAYDRFLQTSDDNHYAQVTQGRWQLSVDKVEKLGTKKQEQLDELKKTLSKRLLVIKLPELLIDVNNDLQHLTDFCTPSQSFQTVEDKRILLATIMAHGCNIGPSTMARLTNDITYRQIKQVTDWQLTEEAQRSSLAKIVQAISQLDVTQAWGEGRTSSSDGQRFALPKKVLQQTFSTRFHEFALEFYSFVADNYAPFYSLPIECNDRDAAYVLDGLLYNETDLALEEHYTDTHGYTEINFAAFAMLGKQFAPRIRNIQDQHIYRISKEKDYRQLTPLVSPSDRAIHTDWVAQEWDRMGQFYASLESGHVTASTALKRLVGFSPKNHFYRANRELGRIFKTEYILNYLSDPVLRQRNRRGLLKGEQMHALAREVNYGKRGRLGPRDWDGQRIASNCLTLILASIIYWQAKEINRILIDIKQQDGLTVNNELITHISPIGWENIILYGEYIIDPHRIRA
ncbi:Tn3 family transposase [Tunicatimonas pelagia]|uniref:Tn3 family transposase n=1 Tax=Tunicatimonas pelagia TaxID=931531 RepID=UPI002665C85D|nr:Tn3 family transposase [Tunicatimonas pelagia]WKN46429.1 Tn3 family transposase [Tunicatimonas pelagia]